MTYDLEEDINHIKEGLNKDGFFLLSGYLANSQEIIDIKNKIYELVCIKATQSNIPIPKNSEASINETIISLYNINKSIGGFLNDTLNSSPELFRLLNSDYFIELAKKIIGDETCSILINNHRIRVQIPGTDDISNLPWHQDSHYNNFYKENNSIVIWTSLYDINEEAGPLVFKKGSHRLKKVPTVEFKKPNNQVVYTIPDRFINNAEFPEDSFETKSEDVVLVDMNVIHKSGKNTSNNIVKFSLQCRCHNASTKGFLPQYD
jgi:ectoine hydroxylase-related dioxygenase (phytanoyl-CoA dioxygenase family)